MRRKPTDEFRFTSLRALNSISGGDGRPTIASVTLDVLTFPLQAVVFGPAYLEHSIQNQEYLSELSAFSNKCDQTYAEIRTNSEAFVAIGLGCTRYGCRSLKALTDASIDLSDRALLTVAVDALSHRGETIVSNVFCRKEWRADTLRMIEPWLFMSLDSCHPACLAPYFLNPALPQDIAESYTNFPHFLRRCDYGRTLEYVRKVHRGYLAKRNLLQCPLPCVTLRKVDAFILDLIGSTQSVTNWQRSGMWDSCVCGDPVGNLTFQTDGGVTATVSKVYARRQGGVPNVWKAGDPLVDPAVQAMILDFPTPEDCSAFLKELIPVFNYVKPCFLSKIFYRPELNSGRVFAVCTERVENGIGRRLFIVNLAADIDIRFWTPTEFHNEGPWATCL